VKYYLALLQVDSIHCSGLYLGSSRNSVILEDHALQYARRSYQPFSNNPFHRLGFDFIRHVSSVIDGFVSISLLSLCIFFNLLNIYKANILVCILFFIFIFNQVFFRIQIIFRNIFYTI